MKNQYINRTNALRLKSLGFKERVLTYFEDEKVKLHDHISGWDFNSSFLNCVSRPTYSQAFNWLLETHHVYGVVIPTITMHWTFKTMTVTEGMIEAPPYTHVDANDYSKRHEAEHALFEKLLKLVEQTKK